MLFYTKHDTKPAYAKFVFALPPELFNLTPDSTASEIEDEFLRVALAYRPNKTSK